MAGKIEIRGAGTARTMRAIRMAEEPVPDRAVFCGMELPEHTAAIRNTIAKRPAYKKAMSINYGALMEVPDGAA